MSKRAQLVEMRKRLLVQIKAHQKLGTAELFAHVDADLKRLLDTRIAEMEERIASEIASDDTLAEPACILRSIPGIGPVASAMLLAEMSELGGISGERRALRHVMFQAALVAAHHNPTLKAFAQPLRKAGKPHKVIIAVARKLVTIANALCRSRKPWAAQAG